MELESLLRVAVAATLLTVSVQGALATKLNVNLVTNPGFESGNTRWTSTNGTWGTNVTTSSAAAHSGTAGLSITGSDLWVYQTVRSLEDFTTYRLSTWFKGTNISDRIGIKLEFLDANDAAIPSTSYTYYFNSNDVNSGQWRQGTIEYKTPSNTASVRIYLRMWGSGTIYFDDVDFEAIKAKELIPVSTDQEFYYTGDTTGTINVILDTYSVRLNPSSTNTSNNIHSDTSLNIDVPAAYTINFTTNAATKELQIYFSMDTSANGNAWLDDVSLIKN